MASVGVLNVFGALRGLLWPSKWPRKKVLFRTIGPPDVTKRLLITSVGDWLEKKFRAATAPLM